MKCTLKSGKATDKRKKFVLKFIIAFVFASSFSGILGSGPGAIKSSFTENFGTPTGDLVNLYNEILRGVGEKTLTENSFLAGGTAEGSVGFGLMISALILGMLEYFLLEVGYRYVKILRAFFHIMTGCIGLALVVFFENSQLILLLLFFLSLVFSIVYGKSITEGNLPNAGGMILIFLMAALIFTFGESKEFHPGEGLKRVSEYAGEKINAVVYGENLLKEGKLLREYKRDKEGAERTALVVRGRVVSPMYLSAFSGELYDGISWRPLPNEAYYSEKNKFYHMRKEGFDSVFQLSHVMDLVKNERNTSMDMTEQKLYVKVKHASKKYVYHPYELSDFRRKEEIINIGGKGLAPAGFTGAHAYELKWKGSVLPKWPETGATLYSLKTSKTSDRYLRLESNYNRFVYDNYVQLSRNTEKIIANLLGSKGRTKEGHISYKRAIETVTGTLDEKFLYSNRGKRLKKNEDFFEAFTEEGRGYDVHFATAATLMFRYYGIPARYVEGYIITQEDIKGMDKNKGIISIPLKNSHSWTEIYIDGLGFVPVEVSLPYKKLMPEPEMEDGLKGEKALKPKEEKDTGGGSSLQKISDAKEKEWDFVYLVYIIAAVAIGALFLQLLYFFYRIASKRLAVEKLIRHKDNRVAVSAMFGILTEAGFKEDLDSRIIAIGYKSAYSQQNINLTERANMEDIFKKLMKKRGKRKSGTLLMSLVLTVTMLTSCNTRGRIEDNLHEYINCTGDYLLEKNSGISTEAVGGDWIIYGLVKAGYNLPKTVKKDYIFSVKGKLKRYEGEIGRQPTDYVRTSLALWALNENPDAIQGYDLTSQFKGFKKIKDQGLNSVIYSLIGLNFVKKHNSRGKDREDVRTLEEKLLTYLVKNEEKKGGFSFQGGSRVDMTAMALNSLAYYEKRPDIKRVIKRSVKYLAAQIDGNGDMGNCEATAQTIIGLTSIGVNPLRDKRFIKDGKDLTDGLQLYYRDGGFAHKKKGKVNSIATEQAMLALAALKQQRKGGRLYEPI